MSPIDKVRIIVAVLYVLVCLVIYWRLIPRLTFPGKYLATFMLGAQVLALVMALIVHPEPHRSSYSSSLWNLNVELNFPAVLATTQLALVGVVAMLTAWFSRTLPFWHRLYWVGIALLFLLLAREELLEQRRTLFLGYNDWVYFYAAVGAVVVGATATFGVRSPRHSRIWSICLMVGLAIGGAGSIVVEQLRFSDICGILGFWENASCMLYMVEESLEFLGIWLTLVAVLGQFSDAAPSLRLRVRVGLFVLPAFLLIQAVHLSPLTRSAVVLMQRDITERLAGLPLEFEFRFLGQRSSVMYQSGVDIEAYGIDHGEGTLTVWFFAKVEDWQDYSGLGYSVHLVDQATGSSVAGIDDAARRQHSFLGSGPQNKHYLYRQNKPYYYKQSIELVVPTNAAVNRALWIVLTTWREEGDEYIRQKIVSSDRPLIDDTQVVLGELVLPAEPATPLTGPLAVFDNGFALSAADILESARPGGSLSIPFTWSAEKDGTEANLQFLHFGNEETGDWWVYDQQPLGSRLPTRLWYSGLADSETWEVPLPVDLAPGRYNLFTGLYRASDLERLPVSDADGTLFADARVPLGTLTIGDA